MQRREGFVDFKDYKTWYEVNGDLGATHTPLIGLHGGPGWPHYSLLPLTALAERGIPIVLYDQIGCGRSDRPLDPDFWTVQSYIEELETVRCALGIEKVSLLGHSWGGTLALEYTLAHPERVDKLVLHSPLLDTDLWIKEADRLKDLLPPEIAAAMRRHEAGGTTDDPEYAKAYEVFKQNFVCRIVPQPEQLDKADEGMGRNVYEGMWGPSEAYATGSLKGYSVIGRLKDVHAPTLLISGKYDEATPRQMELVNKYVPNCDWLLLENSSHSALFEETEKYLQAVQAFID